LLKHLVLLSQVLTNGYFECIEQKLVAKLQ